ncbi:MAG TPA: hypothetical protein PLQ97_05200 [Myxococcota bacterium]|nr:hypothetical protein [Myxococcota bacterium]HQK51643.1 hypothetical protein [Myxococcota bacterium]
MGHRVLGITWGRETVRVAVVETRLRRFELKGVQEWPRRPASMDEEAIPEVPGVGSEGVGSLLAARLNPPPGPLDTVVVAYPGERAFVRRFQFPFRKAMQIDAALPFQWMSLLPVPMEEMHTAWEPVSPQGGGLEVLGVATPAASLTEFLERNREMGLAPVRVSMDGVCLLSLLPWCEEPPGEEAGALGQMLVWAEEDRVELVVTRGRAAVMVRSSTLGEEVMSDGEVSSAFLREVVISVAAAAAQGAEVTRIRVAGPSADRLLGPLQEAVAIPCEVLDPARCPIPGAALCPGLDPRFAKVVALALGAASGTGPGSLNLRTGPFAVEGGRGLIRDRAGFFTWILALFLVLGAARAGVRWHGLRAEKAALNQELALFTKAVLGEEKSSFEAALKQMKSLNEDDLKVFPPWTAVGTLGRIARAMEVPVAAGEGDEAPAGHPLELESVRIDPKQVSLRGEAKTIEVLDAFVARLQADPCFQDVVTESTERVMFQRHQGWQRYSLRWTVDCAKAEAPRKGKDPSGKETGAAKPPAR